ncbi:MAG: trypsin-like peptidase domain-containing protein [Chloroherpetonaceae bacterium]|nr:trypsin-like peptidase domain-containing protein [Chloroherpetonaceae bacterium]MCS7210849.1 trypsin-like peptidase domain-containing protein [Chloroherpetonaceae bacterium]MDW8018464.1 trypsin-like peptidase domain-containing protein [Chloroherpetonaceae bacterium]
MTHHIKHLLPLLLVSGLTAMAACVLERKPDEARTEVRASEKDRIEHFASPSSLYAQTQADDITRSRHNAITHAVAVASPSVVGINVTEVREYQVRDPFSFFFEDDPFFGPFMRRRNQILRQEVKSLGSGFFISSDGYIVTNSHVAGNAAKIVVTTIDGKQHHARLVGADDLTDIALLKVDDGGPFPALKLGDSDDVIVGEWTIAMGNPFGLFEISNKPIVTVGVVSSTGLNFPDVQGRSYRDMIQTDAAINSGNSGGPLLNANAEVIGVNTFIYTGGGAGSIGIGFAIPINRVKKIVEELKAKGRIERSFKTGISVQALTPQLARYFGVEQGQGVVVVNVEKGSTADRAGVKVGDIIVEADGQKVRNEQELMFAVRELRAGDILKLKVIRDRKMLEIAVKLEKQ